MSISAPNIASTPDPRPDADDGISGTLTGLSEGTVVTGLHVRGWVLLLTVVLLVSACANSDSAATASDISFVSILDADEGSGTFAATGRAVESGSMCPSGTYTNVDSDYETEPWWFEDLWVCADGSGSFTMRTEGSSPDVPAAELKSVEGTWTVVGPKAGDYAELTGGGSFESSLDSDWNETFTGDLTLP